MNKIFKLLLDIAILAVVSILAFIIEQYLNGIGWITVGPEARGVSAVVAGVFTAIALVGFRGEGFSYLGIKRPERWRVVPIQVILIVLAFIAAQAIVPLLVGQLFEVPAPDLSNYDHLAGNLTASLKLALLMPVTAAIPEEVIYRGFLMGRLSDIFGRGRMGASITVVVAAMFFASVHFMNWGLGGVIVTFMMGLIWGTAYLLCNRNLWVVIIAHSTVHILFTVQLYLGTNIVI